ncbi:MAG TPA: helix-turn-helix transcriptional regulator [Microbacteriaceae bacterium]
MPEKRWPGALELGRRIVKQRQLDGLSRETVAALAGVDLSNLGRIERGDVNPSFFTLVRIAGTLGIDVAELVAGIGVEMLPPHTAVLTAREFANERRRRAAD